MDKFQLNNKLLINGYLPTLATSKASNFNPIQLDTIQKHCLIDSLLNRYELRNFHNKSYNTVLSYYAGKAKAKKITKAMKKYLFMVCINTRNIAVFKPRYFYRLLITTDTSNFRVVGNSPTSYYLVDSAGCNAFTNLKSSLSKLRRYLHRSKHSNCNIIATNSVYKFNNDLHTHGLVVTLTDSNAIATESMLESYLDNQLGYNVNVSLTPLRYQPTTNSNQVVIDSDNYSDDSNYQAINQWLNYCYKSYRLAFINNSNDLHRWNLLTSTDKQKYVFSVINSTRKFNPKWITKRATYYLRDTDKHYHAYHKVITFLREYTGIRVSYSVSYKRKIRSLLKRIRLYKQVVNRLSSIYFTYAKYGVIQQLTLPIKSTVVTKTKNESTKYSWLDMIHSKQEKIHAKEILKRGRISYKYAIETTRDPVVCVVKKHSLTITSANPLASKYVILNYEKNKKLKLFNSS